MSAPVAAVGAAAIATALRPARGPLSGPALTALGPLRARVADAARRLPVLGDRWAVALSTGLAVASGGALPVAPLRPGTVVRTAIIDRKVRAAACAGSVRTVVELGAGFNTRFERLDDGGLRWFDVDLPVVAELRERLMRRSARRRHLGSCLLTPGWLEVVAAAPGPHCFVMEAVLGYLPGDGARTLLAAITARFPGATLILDVPRGHVVVGHRLARAPRPAGEPAAAIARWVPGLVLVETDELMAASPWPARDRAAPADVRAPYRVAVSRAAVVASRGAAP